MPRRHPVCLTLALGFVLSGAGCEERNPERISRQRHPEMYAPTAAPRVSTELPTGDEVSAHDGELPGERLDLSGERAGIVTVAVNDPAFARRLDPLFDGATTTLSRTEEVNPLTITFRFPAPLHLTGVRLYPSYSSYDWSVDVDGIARPMLVRHAAPDTWSAIRLNADVPTSEVKVTVRRLERDDFVHVNEVELWTVASR